MNYHFRRSQQINKIKPFLKSEQMKIGELRNIIKTHKKEKLEHLVAELYKLIPKDKIMDYDVDNWILQPPEKGKNTPATTKKKRNIQDIAQEVKFFCSNAYAQNYMIPNHSIPKKDRPKWRFVVKRLYKEIQTAIDDKNNPLACIIELEKLYKVLTYACHWQIFSAYDSFESVGLSQTEFFDKIVTLNRNHKDLKDFIRDSIRLIIDNALNRYTLHSELIHIFIKKCNTNDLLMMCFEQAETERNEVLKEPDENKTRTSYFSNINNGMSYQKVTKLNSLTEIGFTAKIKLNEFKMAIEYFNRYHIQRDPEVKLFILVRLLFQHSLKDYIVAVIESSGNVDPRKNLMDLLQYIKTNGTLPAHI